MTFWHINKYNIIWISACPKNRADADDGIGSFLFCDDSDGISTGGQGIVTIVIENSRQMQCALLAGSFKIVEDAVLILQKRFLRIEQSG